jgi:hypothetical protein
MCLSGGGSQDLTFPGSGFTTSATATSTLEGNSADYINSNEQYILTMQMDIAEAEVFLLTGSLDTWISPDAIYLLDYPTNELVPHYGRSVISLSIHSITDDQEIYSTSIYSGDVYDNQVGNNTSSVNFEQLLTPGSYRVTASAESGFGNSTAAFDISGDFSSVPIPAPFWLLATGLVSLTFATKRRAFKR